MGRVVVSLFIALHLVASVANFTRDTPAGGAVRAALMPYDRTIALAQEWDMFAPDPPKSDYHLREEIFTLAGDWEPIEPHFRMPEVQVRFRNFRSGKFERLLFESDNTGERRLRARTLCRQRAEAGDPIAGVRFVRTWTRNPRPRDRLAGIPENRSGETVLGEEWCR